MAKSNVVNEPYPPHAALFLTGRDLDPQKITTEFGVHPRRSYKRGDKRQNGEKDWSHGLWMLSSSGEIKDLDLSIHIKWLIDKLEPAKMGLIDISKDDSIDAVISCFWIMPSLQEELVIDPELLQQIAAFNIRFTLSVIAPDH